MPRLMSVAHTTEQVRSRQKTVTRRAGWTFLRPGDRLTLCEKVQGRRPGEPLVRLAEVVVESVVRVRLGSISPAEVTAEGFPDWTPEQFVAFYCTTFGVEPDTLVTRIQWRYLPDP